MSGRTDATAREQHPSDGSAISTEPESSANLPEILGAAIGLGLTSFGGPTAHIGYFRQEYVVQRRWLDDASYADLVALCQFLPGPASSQVGISIGMLRGGLLGGIAAWIGFTLPSALALIAFAYGVQALGTADAPWLHGLKIVAVAVVAQALWAMARTLCPDRPRASIALAAAVVVLVIPTAAIQVAVIALAGLIGWRTLSADAPTSVAPLSVPIGRRTAAVAWVVLVALLLGLPLLRAATTSPTVALIDSFFRVGSLVFGGGHVVLPLLQTEVVPTGWVDQEVFVAGYGAAQAVPGPLFTFSAYLGAARQVPPGGVVGGLIALVAIFMPSFLLVAGSLPFWGALRTRPSFQAGLRGINAAVVGILLAALYDPIWTSAIERPIDVALALIAFGLLAVWTIPPWAVVIFSALLASVVAAIGL